MVSDINIGSCPGVKEARFGREWLQRGTRKHGSDGYYLDYDDCFICQSLPNCTL